ncbi:thioredoxin reductase (NADPH) [Rhodoligotrophos appendicifer]|uniref:FAD-dependent oxidoreductase n=1 Tax=Rhodoligotrophos appendicifer TaxID=987056 RepID=UPI001FEC67F3|nr:FAD-dependent oxidoreductase [Rhodoligotrophos appendicifer]
MAERATSYGTIEQVARGTHLYIRGQRHADFFIVLGGSIEILEAEEDGTLRLLTTHTLHEFTGELDLLSERANLVTATTGEDSALIRMERTAFHRFLSAEPDIGEIIMRAFILRRMGFVAHNQAGVVLVGSSREGDTLRLQRFLVRNNYPHRLVDPELDEDTRHMLSVLDVAVAELPVVLAPGSPVLRNPTTSALADALGLTEIVEPSEVFDVVVAGAGPAGLAAAVYAASEGLKTLVIEELAPGGQAGTSSRIENYLGFPTGISGQALAGRAQVQAQKFGARLMISRQVTSIKCDQRPYQIGLDDGQEVNALAVVVATGARYRKLDLDNYARFEGQGIHYAATAMEALLCQQQEVIVVGGGNSAGQAAVFLSRTVKHVHILVRGAGLSETMSDYLIQRIDSSSKITLHPRTEISALGGEKYLDRVTWTNVDTGRSEVHAISNIFVMIGAVPNTEWLRGCLKMDDKGFVQTGSDTGSSASPLFATTTPGVFAVGDVRSGSVKRVASGVGEGSVVVQAIHRFLSEPT